MNTGFLSIAFLLFPFCALIAQDEEQDVVVEKQDRLIIDVGHESFIYGQRPDGLEHELYSNGFNFQFMLDKPLGDGNVSLAAGLGISRQNYHSNGIVRSGGHRLPDGNVLGEPDDGVHYTIIDEDDEYGANRLSTTFLELPVELRFRTNPNEKGHSWKFNFGFKAGYLTGVHDKQEFEGDKYKWFVFPDITEIRYGPYFRMGFGKIGITGYYAVNTFYNSGTGPEMNQLSIGLSIQPF